MTAETIVYECRCGNQVEIAEQNVDRLFWLKRKFGFTNTGEAIGHNTECCARPEYVTVPLARGGL